MRLHEREAFFRQRRGVVTMADMERERKDRQAQERHQEERQRREAKAATLGPSLLEVSDV